MGVASNHAILQAMMLAALSSCTDGGVQEPVVRVEPAERVEPRRRAELDNAAPPPAAKPLVQPEVDEIDARFVAGGLVEPNTPQPFSALPPHVKKGAVAHDDGISVYADFDHPVRQPYLATSIYVVNRGDEPIQLPMIDWLSKFGVEVPSPDGEWILHQGPPTRVFCGNSFHDLEIPSQSFVRLEAQRWETGAKTRVRFRNVDGPNLISNSGIMPLDGENEIWERGYGFSFSSPNAM